MSLIGNVLLVALYAFAVAPWLSSPAFAVLAGMTYAADRRSRRLWLADDDVEKAPAQMSPFAHRSKVAAFSIVGLMLVSAGAAGASATLHRIPFAGVLGVVSGQCFIGAIALSLALVVLLVLTWRDVRTRHRLAGRDARDAYLAVAVAFGLQIGFMVVMSVNNVQML
jgi:hypothetical protein